MQEQSPVTYGAHRAKFRVGPPRIPKGLIVSAWAFTLASYLPSGVISFLAYCCAFGCGIALIRHKNKDKVTKISGWLITILFSIRFIVLIFIILRNLNVVQF